MWMLKWANSQVGREVDPSRPLRYSLQPSSVRRGSWARSRAGGYLGPQGPSPRGAVAATPPGHSGSAGVQPAPGLPPWAFTSSLPSPAQDSSLSVSFTSREQLASQGFGQPVCGRVRTLPEEDEEQDKAQLWGWKESRVAQTPSGPCVELSARLFCQRSLCFLYHAADHPSSRTPLPGAVGGTNKHA